MNHNDHSPFCRSAAIYTTSINFGLCGTCRLSESILKVPCNNSSTVSLFKDFDKISQNILDQESAVTLTQHGRNQFLFEKLF